MADEPTREELDERALREHIAANPTPPSGPQPIVKEVVVRESEAPAKTTEFRRKDGTLLCEITLGTGWSRTSRIRRAAGEGDT